MSNLTQLILGVLAIGALASWGTKDSQCFGGAIFLVVLIGIGYALTHH